MMARQLRLDLPARAALGRDDFFVSPANALALAMIDDWTGWPDGKMALCGPRGAGKTHLAHVWAEATGARILPAADLAGADLPALARGPVAVEDVPDIAADDAAQTALFHLHNLARAARQHLLMTGQDSPKRWALSLPDLQSRIEAASVARLEPPDDALLEAVLLKLFADRQIAPRPDVIPFLVRRMDRSFDAAARMVDRLDRAAMEKGQSLSRGLVSSLLAAPEAD
jgi:chromosomal replication initiation ATPase DnaA